MKLNRATEIRKKIFLCAVSTLLLEVRGNWASASVGREKISSFFLSSTAAAVGVFCSIVLSRLESTLFVVFEFRMSFGWKDDDDDDERGTNRAMCTQADSWTCDITACREHRRGLMKLSTSYPLERSSWKSSSQSLSKCSRQILTSFESEPNIKRELKNILFH